ncbi:hypothetical protein NMY22_g16322 [Coprinellus aureogranulatus]|nr:hypothetical protein NMY22_g16322 [Coprinellus aureogranulatus]
MAPAAPTKREIAIVVFLLSFFLLFSNLRSSTSHFLPAALRANAPVKTNETQTQLGVAPIQDVRQPFNARLTWNLEPVPQTKIALVSALERLWLRLSWFAEHSQ